MAKQIKDRLVKHILSGYFHLIWLSIEWVLPLRQRVLPSHQPLHRANQCNPNSRTAVVEWYQPSFVQSDAVRCWFPCEWVPHSMLRFTRIHPLLYGPILSYSSTCFSYLQFLSMMQSLWTFLVILSVRWVDVTVTYFNLNHFFAEWTAQYSTLEPHQRLGVLSLWFPARVKIDLYRNVKAFRTDVSSSWFFKRQINGLVCTLER